MDVRSGSADIKNNLKYYVVVCSVIQLVLIYFCRITFKNKRPREGVGKQSDRAGSEAGG